MNGADIHELKQCDLRQIKYLLYEATELLAELIKELIDGANSPSTLKKRSLRKHIFNVLTTI